MRPRASKTIDRARLLRDLLADRAEERAELAHAGALDELRDARPRTRAECADGPRPCPWLSCRHHLYLDVMPNGSVKLNFPDVPADELERLPSTCALDVADEGRQRISTIARVMNVSRPRVKQIIEKGLRHARRGFKRRPR